MLPRRQLRCGGSLKTRLILIPYFVILLPMILLLDKKKIKYTFMSINKCIFLSQQCSWGVTSCGMWLVVFGWAFPDVEGSLSRTALLLNLKVSRFLKCSGKTQQALQRLILEGFNSNAYLLQFSYVRPSFSRSITELNVRWFELYED
jgi:hypothetical protein